MKLNMNKVKRILALAFVSAALAACHSNSDSGTPVGGVGTPGYNGGSVVPTPGGGMQVSFSGSSVYNSGILLSGGYTAASSYCGWFANSPNYLQQNCWPFSNKTHFNPLTGTYDSGQLVPSAGGLPAYQGGTITYTGTSVFELGATISVVSTVPVNNWSAITGSVVLPPSFVQRNIQAFPQGAATPIIGIAIDMGITSNNGYQYQYQNYGSGTYNITGGVLIYTSGSIQSGYHGVFLRL